MVKRTLLCLLMVVSCIGAEADIVKGRVLDAQTKEPLEGATVTFEQRDGDSYWMNSTYTDSLGRFTVWAESMRTTIKASFIGYYDKSKRIVCQEGRDTTQLEDILLV